MSNNNNSKILDFIKRNAYYLAFVVCLAVLVVITVSLIVSDNQGALEVNGGAQVEEESGENEENQGGSENEENQGGNGNEENNGGNEQEEQKPTAIIFDMPVDGEIIKDYVGASVIYNQTLGVYTGHKAIDFSASEGSVVSCVYDGVIESIEISKINGTTVTVDHGNGLMTVYNSIEANENLTEGMTVKKGDALGVVSTNNKTEYLDGAHLHFEVLEDGEKVDPNKYLVSEGK